MSGRDRAIGWGLSDGGGLETAGRPQSRAAAASRPENSRLGVFHVRDGDRAKDTTEVAMIRATDRVPGSRGPPRDRLSPRDRGAHRLAGAATVLPPRPRVVVLLCPLSVAGFWASWSPLHPGPPPPGRLRGLVVTAVVSVAAFISSTARPAASSPGRPSPAEPGLSRSRPLPLLGRPAQYERPQARTASSTRPGPPTTPSSWPSRSSPWPRR